MNAPVARITDITGQVGASLAESLPKQGGERHRVKPRDAMVKRAGFQADDFNA